MGAISSESAADHYGLHVLERGIGRGTNVFRFILLAREPLVTSALPAPVQYWAPLLLGALLMGCASQGL